MAKMERPAAFVGTLMIAFSLSLAGCVPTPAISSGSSALVTPPNPSATATNTPVPPTISYSTQTVSPEPGSQNTAGRTPVVFLGDGAPDDITAAMYLMLDDAIWLRGIVVTNGETHPSIAISKWRDYIYQYMGWMDVQVVPGCDCAVDPHPNQFPESWRTGADNFWGISLPKYTGKVSNISGADLIINLANEYPGKLVVLITGPHTDLALALRKDPTLQTKIKKVSIMGGAINVTGNIHADWAAGTNTVSEWNIWVDPMAAAEVLSSGIPVDILPMDTVPDVHLDRAFSEKVDAINLPGADLMAEIWRAEFSMFQSDQILMWDVLAAIAIDHPDDFKWVIGPVEVNTAVGPDQGRTVALDGTSTTIHYAVHAEQQAILDHLYNIFPPRGTIGSTTTDPIAGTWVGTIASTDGTFSTPIKLSIRDSCGTNAVCGTFDVPQLLCSGNLFLSSVVTGTFMFAEQDNSGAASCTAGGYEYLQLQANGVLRYQFAPTQGANIISSGLLEKQ